MYDDKNNEVNVVESIRDLIIYKGLNFNQISRELNIPPQSLSYYYSRIILSLKRDGKNPPKSEKTYDILFKSRKSKKIVQKTKTFCNRVKHLEDSKVSRLTKTDNLPNLSSRFSKSEGGITQVSLEKLNIKASSLKLRAATQKELIICQSIYKLGHISPSEIITASQQKITNTSVIVKTLQTYINFLHSNALYIYYLYKVKKEPCVTIANRMPNTSKAFFVYGLIFLMQLDDIANFYPTYKESLELILEFLKIKKFADMKTPIGKSIIGTISTAKLLELDMIKNSFDCKRYAFLGRKSFLVYKSRYSNLLKLGDTVMSKYNSGHTIIQIKNDLHLSSNQNEIALYIAYRLYINEVKEESVDVF